MRATEVSLWAMLSYGSGDQRGVIYAAGYARASRSGVVVYTEKMQRLINADEGRVYFSKV